MESNAPLGSKTDSSFEFDLGRISDLVERLRSLYGKTAGEDESDMERFIRLFPEPERD